MEEINPHIDQLRIDIDQAKNKFIDVVRKRELSVHIFTHIDADGLSSGAILGKALYRENIPFQITALKQLEKTEIQKIALIEKDVQKYYIFSDFGSGQYLELVKCLSRGDPNPPFIILDHHLPQGVAKKENRSDLKKVYDSTKPWHLNPYFYELDGSNEVSGAGMCYLFAKSLNGKNVDLSPIALIGAIGDIQNQDNKRGFTGINLIIEKDALTANLIEIFNDLNYSSMKPLNEAIGYSTEIQLPGLSGDVNKSLLFLKSLGILIEKPDGTIKNLTELSEEEKKILSSGIIKYSSLKLNENPSEVINKLIIKRYILKQGKKGSYMYDLHDFSILLNACGRTSNASLGITIAMGGSEKLFSQAQEVISNYNKSLVKALEWIQMEDRIKQLNNLQYFLGEEIIPETIVGVISSMLIFDNNNKINKEKPLFGMAKREGEDVYKVSARAHQNIIDKGINLSEVIREASKLSKIDFLGGGHPPAAGTKIPLNSIKKFLENCDKVIELQLH